MLKGVPGMPALDPEAVLGNERPCDAAFASEMHARSDTFVV